MTRILSIGLGGVGVIAAYTLQEFNKDVEVTAVIRLDYDKVTKDGYTISSIDYGGRKDGTSNITGFRPSHIVKSIDDAAEFGPFDYVVVSTKLVPTNTPRDIWNEVTKHNDKVFHDHSAIVLVQNGIFIEKYWEKLIPLGISLISGVSYISSVNTNGFVTQYGHDSLLLGLFDSNKGDPKLVERFVDLYETDHNSSILDPNPRYTRWKKLLYNASFNTICCLTNLDVGKVYGLGEESEVIKPLMQEIQLAANKDLATVGSETLIKDDDIELLLYAVKTADGQSDYQPSMLVDFRNNRPIELEIILGNVIRQFAEIGGDVKKEIPNLMFTYHLLKVVQYGLSNGFYKEPNEKEI